MKEEHRAILQGRRNAYLATLMPDGSPHVTPVWIDVDGEDVVVNTSEGTVKLANVRRDPRVAVNIESEDDRYRVLSLRGSVIAIESSDAVDEHIDALSMRHDGVPWTPEDEEARVRIRIRPERVSLLQD